jgi:hypothetical protein
MGELGRDWLRGVGVTVPVTGGGGNNQAWPLCWPLDFPLTWTPQSVTGVVGCSVYNETWAPGHSGGAFLPSDSVFTVKRANGEAPGPLTPCLTKTHFPFVGTALDATVRAAGEAGLLFDAEAGVMWSACRSFVTRWGGSGGG